MVNSFNWTHSNGSGGQGAGSAKMGPEGRSYGENWEEGCSRQKAQHIGNLNGTEKFVCLENKK